jgi:hypothetical protein
MPSSVGHLIRVIVLVALLTVPLAGAARVVAQEPLVLRVGTIDGRGLAGALREEGFSVVWPVDKTEL